MPRTTRVHARRSGPPNELTDTRALGVGREGRGGDLLGDGEPGPILWRSRRAGPVRHHHAGANRPGACSPKGNSHDNTHTLSRSLSLSISLLAHTTDHLHRLILLIISEHFSFSSSSTCLVAVVRLSFPSRESCLVWHPAPGRPGRRASIISPPVACHRPRFPTSDRPSRDLNHTGRPCK